MKVNDIITEDTDFGQGDIAQYVMSFGQIHRVNVNSVPHGTVLKQLDAYKAKNPQAEKAYTDKELLLMILAYTYGLNLPSISPTKGDTDHSTTVPKQPAATAAPVGSDKPQKDRYKANRMGSNPVSAPQRAKGAIGKAWDKVADPFKRGAAFADKYVTPPKSRK